jgi:hypothetical protein
LGIGIAIAALVAGDFFFADSHGRKMWMPSRFAFRVVTTTSLLAYFVVREMRRTGLLQMLASVLFATLVQLGILFGFRQIVDQLPGINYSALAVLEMFLVWQLTVQVAHYLSSGGRAS